MTRNASEDDVREGRYEIAVIGAGISGLSAANRIRELRPETRVVVLDAGAEPGGVLQTVERDGYLLESSADSFITNVPWALELCRRLGLEHRLVETDTRHRRAFVVRRGRLEPIPDGLLIMAPSRIGPLLGTRILSWPGKVRMGLERFVPRGDGRDESLASFARRRFGREAYERLIQPLLGGMYTGDPERLGVRATMPRFLEMEQAHGSLIRAIRRGARREGSTSPGAGARYGLFAGLAGGLTDLVRALHDRLNPGVLQMRSPVERLARSSGGGWSIEVGGDSPRRLVAGRVILATASDQAARLIGSHEPEAARMLAEIPLTSSAIVSLGYRRNRVAHPLDGFGFVVPFAERLPILSGSFSSVKFSGRAPEGHVLFRVFIGGSVRPDLVEADDDTLFRLAESELSALLGIAGEPGLRGVVRWRKIMPQYEVGHLERVASIESRVAGIGGITLAGNWLRGVGVPMCIHSGELAAERVAAEAASPSAVR